MIEELVRVGEFLVLPQVVLLHRMMTLTGRHKQSGEPQRNGRI